MQRSTNPLALAIQKADREFRADAKTAEEITRPVILAPMGRRLMRESEPALQLYLEIEAPPMREIEAPSMQVDDEFDMPRRDEGEIEG